MLFIIANMLETINEFKTSNEISGIEGKILIDIIMIQGC